jgi:hypothetical protein
MGRTTKNGTFAARLTFSRTTNKTEKTKKIQQHVGKASRRATTAPGMLPVGPLPRP